MIRGAFYPCQVNVPQSIKSSKDDDSDVNGVYLHTRRHMLCVYLELYYVSDYENKEDYDVNASESDVKLPLRVAKQRCRPSFIRFRIFDRSFATPQAALAIEFANKVVVGVH